VLEPRERKKGPAGRPFWENEPTLLERNTWISSLCGAATERAASLSSGGACL
jgi:hypothetical protein